MMNVEINLVTEEERLRPEKSEVNRLFGDNSLLKALTDWYPKHGGKEGQARSKNYCSMVFEPGKLKVLPP